MKSISLFHKPAFRAKIVLIEIKSETIADNLGTIGMYHLEVLESSRVYDV